MGLSDLDQSVADRVVHSAIDHGITTIDTAPLYGAGRCEELVGRAIADRLSFVKIFTKCGLRWDDSHGARMFPMSIEGAERWVRKDSRPSSIARGIDESLARLGIETIDLMQIHHLDVDTRLEDSLAELVRAREAGKIREIGVSNFPAREVERANTGLRHSLFSVQDEFSLVSQERSSLQIEFCRQYRIRFLAYSPLAQGVLAGKYLDANLGQSAQVWSAPWMAPQNLRKINDVLRSTALPIAKAHGATLGQISLAWALAQPGVTDVVAGATSERHVKENAAVMRMAIPSEALGSLTEAIAACQLDTSPKPSLSLRLRAQPARIRRLAGRILRRLGLR
jgi:aryl-alcohol dehydrogenase-like predicted oxidoreductase